MPLPDGRYSVEWWDTWRGKPERREGAVSAEGKLPLSVPELKTDAALLIRPGQ